MSGKEKENPACLICSENFSKENPIFQYCQCNGSFYHADCIKEWSKMIKVGFNSNNNSSIQLGRCQICTQEYKMRFTLPEQLEALRDRWQTKHKILVETIDQIGKMQKEDEEARNIFEQCQNDLAQIEKNKAKLEAEQKIRKDLIPEIRKQLEEEKGEVVNPIQNLIKDSINKNRMIKSLSATVTITKKGKKKTGKVSPGSYAHVIKGL